MEIKVAFFIGDPVEFNNKIGKDIGVISAIQIRPTGFMYAVVWSDKSEKWHYDFELIKRNGS